MSETAERLKAQLATLTEDDRLELASFLLDTLPDSANQDDAWEAELLRRDRELATGKVQEIPADELFRELRENRP